MKIVYFINLRPGKWENILNEQLESLKKIKLYDISHEIYASVISDDNEIIKGSFYNEELQKTNQKEGVYLIEKIIKTRIKNGKK